MKPLPHNPDLLKVAPSVIWFEPAEAALADPVRFLAYLMTYGTVDEIAVVIAAMTVAVALSTLVLLTPSPRAAALKMVPKWSRACSMLCAGAKLVVGSTQGIVDRKTGASAEETETFAGNRKVAPTSPA